MSCQDPNPHPLCVRITRTSVTRPSSSGTLESYLCLARTTPRVGTRTRAVWACRDRSARSGVQPVSALPPTDIPMRWETGYRTVCPARRTGGRHREDVHAHTHIHTHTRTRTHTHTHTRHTHTHTHKRHTHTRTHTHARTHTLSHIHCLTHTVMHTHCHTYTLSHTCARMHARTHARTHTC